MATLTNINKRNASNDFFLRESGFKLLRENGDGILIRSILQLINLARNAATMANQLINSGILTNTNMNTASLTNTTTNAGTLTNLPKS